MAPNRRCLFRPMLVVCASVAIAAGCVKVTMTGGTGGGTGAAGPSTGGANGSGSGSAPGSGGMATGSSSGGATGSGTGGRAATGSGGSGGSTGPGSGGATGDDGGRGSTIADAGTDRVCQQAELKWEPKIPTVYVMVDRSGSMFDCGSTANTEASCPTPADTSWSKLKDAVLAVVSSLQTQVRFGFASFTGTNPMSGGMCPIIDKVKPALDNSAAIATLYNGLAFQPNTTEQGKKFETPARQSLDMIGAELLADTAPGEKYILFVTDGQPDYCDDSNTLCAPDSVVGGLQGLKAKGITTIVMGLQSAVNDLAPGILQSFANAGAGEPTLAPVKANLDTFAFYDQCNGVAGWRADLVSTAKTQERGVTVGTYSTTAGPTKPYTPDVGNQAMLMNQLSMALSGVKSCVFDLGDVNGKSIRVDLTQLDLATVTINGTAIPLSDTNGWRMNSATQLELTGTACTNWRMPSVTTIQFGFPCQIVIIE